MSRAVVLALLLSIAPAAISGQTLVVLHIRAALSERAGQTPAARHALLISDNPATRETRRVVTGLDGTVDVRLRPGNYTVESDQPIAFQGKAYHWTQTVQLGAGGDATLDLTLGNAITEALEAGTPVAEAPAAPAAPDPWTSLRPWLESVVELWTPTAHGTGFLVDASGLVATSQAIVGDATRVEVQLSRTVKVAGMVVHADRERDMAVIRIDPTVLAAARPVPLGCPRTSGPAVERNQEVFALAAPLRQQKGLNPAPVSRVDTRFLTTDFRLATGGLGGPVFTANGDFIGITVPLNARDEQRRGAARVARVTDACDVIAAARAATVAAASAAHLPVEPAEPAPVAAFKDAVRRRAGSLKPYQMAAADFDVSFITPLLNYAAQSQANASFSNWADYVEDIPPVLLVRVTPKKVESMWAKVARGAAYSQGMALPALKRLKSGFDRLQAYCDGTEVTPIHPLKLDLQVSETDTVYEGLYAFDPAALGPQCQTVTLALYSEKEPGKEDRRVVDPGTLQQIRRDLAVGAVP